ncbi:YggS family pyridoxal phosphate enzyme [Arthrobacter sp. B0490]|uniref:YggS family pyridoxal phosphate enzyme n=1 Tax=Arthrobacter sp. B0490 TaxID=2058891 RepID=UPI000CE5300C|nr:alanine racemase [Arthrobacter sp. B0490]
MTPGDAGSGDRRALELAMRLGDVRARIAAAAAGRAAPDLIVVTKYFPASDLRILARLGVADVGENRDQEAAGKAAELEDLALRWHFIGQMQTNKAKSVVRYAHSVHSVDRAPLVDALGKAMAAEQARRAAQGLPDRPDLDCFLQFTLDDGVSGVPSTERDAPRTRSRGGALPADAEDLARAVGAAAGLRLAGVMGVAPLGGDPADAFGRLLRISATVRAVDPSASAVSAGMSGDLEAAVAAGATHLRIGSDVLGPRPGVG